jgi:hypothetical protein
MSKMRYVYSLALNLLKTLCFCTLTRLSLYIFGDQICDSHWFQNALYLLGKHLKLFYVFSLHFGD